MTADRDDIARYRENIQDETDGAFLYRVMAELEEQAQLAELYERLAATEERHASFWEDKIRAVGLPVPPRIPTRRARILAWSARRLGPGVLRSTLAREEQVGQYMYDDQPETDGTSMPADERSHARLLRTLTSGSGGVEGGALARLEGRHRTIGGNALRAAVLGANDGLVSNLALVMGVAGADISNQAVLIAGFAGLLAGASSMAIGEWLSVQSSRELYQRQIDIEAREIEEIPEEEEEEELALIYQAKGLPEVQARQLAARVMADHDTALDTLAREELGIDPDELGGSPWEAATASFFLFAIGAIIPVLPFLFTSGAAAVLTSLFLASVALFGTGAAITLVTGRGPWRSGFRQAALGLAAAGLTYGIGSLLGVAISG
jgi:vacuolar iron transporter family protein